MLAISDIHRKLAKIAIMSTDKNGKMHIGLAELMLIAPLLKQNAELVRRLDELKQLSFHAYEMGDMEWQMDVCRQIDEIEAKCF